jgi:hypothetical protein
MAAEAGLILDSKVTEALSTSAVEAKIIFTITISP